jgi:error-prone DNA polymerase
VIGRQRPGTAKGFVFLSLEDEIGISNVIVNPNLYEKYRKVINREKFLSLPGGCCRIERRDFDQSGPCLAMAIRSAEIESDDCH